MHKTSRVIGHFKTLPWISISFHTHPRTHIITKFKQIDLKFAALFSTILFSSLSVLRIIQF